MKESYVKDKMRANQSRIRLQKKDKDNAFLKKQGDVREMKRTSNEKRERSKMKKLKLKKGLQLKQMLTEH